MFFEKQGLTFANLSEKSLFAKIQAKNDFKKLKKKKKKLRFFFFFFENFLPFFPQPKDQQAQN